MDYIRSSLIPGEKVIKVGQLHWMAYMAPILALGFVFLGSYFVFANTNDNGDFGPIIRKVTMVLMIAATARYTYSILFKIFTEYAVTSKRVIYKTGVIRRIVVELAHWKIEGMFVRQSVFGRLFGYGTITFTGTGSKEDEINFALNPMGFRKTAFEVYERQKFGYYDKDEANALMKENINNKKF